MNRRTGMVRFAVTAALALSASEAFAESPSERLDSLQIIPAEATLWGAGSSQHFLVVGKFADGEEREMAETAVMTIGDPAVAKLDSAGRLVAVANGKTVLKAEVAGQVVRARIEVREFERQRPFSFQRDIGGILTRQGCNGSVCHGGVKGKGGFHLSPDVVDPREDYRFIVKGGMFQVLSAESKGLEVPRVNLTEPEKSLLLLKPTMAVAHGGGLRFKPGSRDYETVLKWIRQGAPFGDADPERIERIDVFPQESVLRPGEKGKILVTAHLSNGRRRDITDEVMYDSDRPEVAQAIEGGKVAAGAVGEAVLVVRAPGHTAGVRVAVIDRVVPHYPHTARRNFIDDHVLAKLRKFNITPSPVSSDGEFLRRVCLDIAGTLPPAARVREFLNDADADKRDRLIEALLDSPEYIDYWTFRFSDLFRIGAGGQGWDEYVYWNWLRKRIAENKPYNAIAYERIAAQGWDGPSRHYMWYAKIAPFERVVAEQVRVFLGRRMDCAQCHNHPYDTWTQDQFWGMAAFFGRLTTTGWVVDQVVYDDPKGNEIDYGMDGKETLGFMSVVHPRTKQPVAPRFLDGTPPKSEDLRVAAAKWMVSHPYFAQAAVNRVWSYFFGRGFVNPVDDFRVTTPPTHPELLEALAADFREHGYDLKHLIRTIAQSRTYQTSSASNETNRDDRTNYSHAITRALEAELLLDAISTATGISEEFDTSPTGEGVAAPAGTRAINLRFPFRYSSRFLDIFGRPTRESVPERDKEPSLSQALHMWVGDTYTQRLSKPGGRLDELLGRGVSDREAIEELYLGALTRFPTRSEIDQIQELIRTAPSRRRALEDVFWALLNSREFASNH